MSVPLSIDTGFVFLNRRSPFRYEDLQRGNTPAKTGSNDRRQERMKLRERIPHTWAPYNENYLKSIFDSVS